MLCPYVRAGGFIRRPLSVRSVLPRAFRGSNFRTIADFVLSALGV
jgi:hypothetical protein